LTPFFLHWYAGDAPPFTGVAVNVTFVPAQIAPEGFEVMEILTGRIGLTVMVIAFEVAGFPEVQVTFEVNTHVTTFPFVRVEVE